MKNPAPLIEVTPENSSQFSQSPPLDGGGGGPYDPSMELRIASLEHRLTSIEAALDKADRGLYTLDGRLRSVETGIASIAGKLDMLSSQLVSKLPSWWQMLALFGGAMGLALAVLKFLKAS